MCVCVCVFNTLNRKQGKLLSQWHTVSTLELVIFLVQPREIISKETYSRNPAHRVCGVNI